MLPTKILIRGTEVNYYFLCSLKLWFFSHNITMEQNSELVKLGKLIHDLYYGSEKKNEIIDNQIAIDFVKKGKIIEIHEIKKSSKMKKAHKFQVLYYIYFLKKKGIDAIGIINYPTERKREIVELNDKNLEILKNALEDIKRIKKSVKPPKPKKKWFCKACSYYELCFCGEE